ncbi:MAG TPA: hypothetical protein VGM17_09745 [Rhizomicrobium sp.]|jgi:hypothetical protein
MSMLRCVLLAAGFVCVVGSAAGAQPDWRGYGGDAQHNANSPVASQNLTRKHWSMPVDLQSQSGFILIHYASPMITESNTVLVPVKADSGGAFRIEAHNGATGDLIWRANSNFLFAPHDWTPSVPAHLTAQNRLYYGLRGGVVAYRDTPDLASGNSGKVVFFGRKNYRQNHSAYDNNVMISTPITADEDGNIYFGFVVTGSTPIGLKSGIARISAGGKGTWISAHDASNGQYIVQVAMNCAPAISRDGKTVYIAVSDGSNGYLLGLNAKNLKPKYRAPLIDPNSGSGAFLTDDSSASPTIGPDGDVYYGVLEYDAVSHNDRGWLLHFNSKLTQEKIPGSFGWDDTVSVVPSNMVPSYHGSSSYLLMSKYNNYYGVGTGDGHNKIAILDPNAEERDPIIPSVKVMNEVLTKIGPTQDPGDPAGAVYEWCINSAVVDPATKSVIANSEDGTTYRWDLTTNSLSQAFVLNPPTLESYTPTLVGPDGTAYAINDAHLYAIGN